jgi:hypothetical protein
MSKVMILNDEQAALCEIRLPDSEWMAAARFMMVEDNLVLAELRIFPAEDRLPEGFTLSDMKKHSASLRKRKLPGPEIGEWSRTVDGLVDREGITMRMLRELKLADLFDPIHEWAKGISGPEGGVQGVWRAMADSPNPGRRPRDDVRYAVWAQRISNRTTDPATRHRPIAAVATDMGLPREQVRDIAHEARRRKVLSDPPAGARGGGLLTEKGRAILAAIPTKEDS